MLTRTQKKLLHSRLYWHGMIMFLLGAFVCWLPPLGFLGGMALILTFILGLSYLREAFVDNVSLLIGETDEANKTPQLSETTTEVTEQKQE